MAETLGAADEFTRTLAEVELLLGEADAASPGNPQENELRFAALNKSALLLLTGKFEAFLEGAAEDFLFAIKQIGAKARHLPPQLIAEHSVSVVQGIEQKLSGGDLAAVRQIFVALGRVWTDVDPCVDLDVSCKFGYGKHGEGQIVKLFKRCGVEDVFARISVADDEAEVYEGGTIPLLDVKGIVNSLSGMRNNILHEDASPTLTSTTLRKQ